MKTCISTLDFSDDGAIVVVVADLATQVTRHAFSAVAGDKLIEQITRQGCRYFVHIISERCVLGRMLETDGEVRDFFRELAQLDASVRRRMQYGFFLVDEFLMTLSADALAQQGRLAAGAGAMH